MCKKATIGVLGLLLVGGLLFGSNGLNYLQTGFSNLRSAANDAVPISMQLDGAKNQLDKIEPQIRNMIHQIAKEKVQVKKLTAKLDQQNKSLDRAKDEMMTLRDHVGTGDQFYVATDGKAYTNERVEEDLRHRFKMFQTAEMTRDKLATILDIRQASLEAALSQVDEAKAQQRELEIQIENLTARNRMNEVVTTASKLNIDNSQLTKTRDMVEDIDSRLAAEEELLNLIPQYSGQIPVNSDDYSSEARSNIVDEMDAYFNKSSDDSNIDVEDDELVLN